MLMRKVKIRLARRPLHMGPSIRSSHSSSTTATAGYQSIGSFHSDNVEDLMAAPDDRYEPPLLPFEDANHPHHSNENDFLLDRSHWTFLNHGAFGAALKCGHVRAQQWRQHLEEQPLRYFDRDLLPHLVYAARQLGKLCNVARHSNTTSSSNGLALVPNVTTAMNAVISGHVRYNTNKDNIQPRVVLWDTSYGSVKKMAHTYGAEVVEIPFQSMYLEQFVKNEKTAESIFVEALEHTLEQHGSYDYWQNDLLILDQTTSNTALNVPIALLAQKAKERGMRVVVDGAHGLLAQDVCLDEMMQHVDVYVSNGHKWLSCPRGVGMMYCSNETTRETLLRQPAVVSHGIDDGYFSRFVWDGTRDYAAQLALPVVLEHWNRANPARVRETMRTTLLNAIELLAHLWHDGCAQDDWVGPVTIAPFKNLSPMALVRLPEPLCGPTKTSADAKRIQDWLFHQHRVECPVKCINGVLYVRLSCHVYNELHEYERLGRVMLQYA